MNGRDFALLLSFVGFFAVIASMVFGAAARRRRATEMDQRRIDLIEKGLQDPTLDAATRAHLLRSLADERIEVPSALWRLVTGAAFWRGLWFGTGWMIFVVGTGLLVAEALDFTRGLNEPITIAATLLGFAMLTLPLGLRELQVRRERTAPLQR